jgi:hypothetical protein
MNFYSHTLPSPSVNDVLSRLSHARVSGLKFGADHNREAANRVFEYFEANPRDREMRGLTFVRFSIPGGNVQSAIDERQTK